MSNLLPSHLFPKVLQHLDPLHLGRAMLVNKEFRGLALESEAWLDYRVVLEGPSHVVPSYAAKLGVEPQCAAAFWDDLRNGNEHPRICDLAIPNMELCTNERLELLAQFPNLKVLDLSDAGQKVHQFPTDWAQPLSCLPHLYVLRVARCGLKDESLWRVSLLTSLQSLDVNHNEITWRGAEYLVGLSGLTELIISNNFIINEGAPHLASLANLQRLDVSYNNLLDSAAPHLASLTALTELDVSGNFMTEQALMHLNDLTNLVVLKGLYNKFNKGALCLLQLPQLLDLDMSLNRGLITGGREGLSSLHRLTSLNICRCDVDDEAAQHLQALTNLQRLDISCNALGFGSLQCLAALSNLLVLDLSTTGWLMLHGLRAVSDLRNLHTLHLATTGLHGAGAVQLSALTNLHTLNVRDNRLGPAALHISSLTRLHTLDISGNELHDADVKYLSLLTKLHTLDIASNNLGTSSVGTLALLANLRTLNAARNALGASPAHSQRLQMLSRLSSLTVLDVSDNQFLPGTVCHLSQLTCLRSLDISANKLRWYAVRFLSCMTKLQNLVASQNLLDNDTVAFVACLTNLRTLKLDRNCIGRRALTSLTTLIKLREPDLESVLSPNL